MRGETRQTVSERDQGDRHEEEWSIPASITGRDDGPQESPHRTPPAPAPSKDRFTNCSSLRSPHASMPLQSVPVEETVPDINLPVNQTTQSGSEPTQIGAMGNAPQNDIIVSSPRTHRQLDELVVRMMDMGTNTSDIEVRSHRDGARIVTSDTNVQAPLLLVD